jgi:hypothetical protein
MRGKVLTPKGHPSIDRLDSRPLPRGQVGGDEVLGNFRWGATFIDCQNSKRIRDIAGNRTTRKVMDFVDNGTEPFQIHLGVGFLDLDRSSADGDNHVIRLLGPDVSKAILEEGVTELVGEVTSSGQRVLAQHDSALDVNEANCRG